MPHRLLRSRHAPLVTHAALVALTVTLFALLLRLPLWIAFVPCALVEHRIGVLLHEYIHGIPFRKYRTNLWVLSTYEGVLLTFGLGELFRGTHLAHHRWLNTEKDPAFAAEAPRQPARWSRITALEGSQHLIYLVESFRGRHPYVRPTRLAVGAVVSIAALCGWIALGRPGIPLSLMLLTVYNTMIPVSFRGAIEHHSHRGDPGFANEYRVVIPLFNLNKHIHHHRDPGRPWYLLEYQTPRPLWTVHYFTHWFRVYLTRDFVLMRPQPRPLRRRAVDRAPLAAPTEPAA